MTGFEIVEEALRLIGVIDSWKPAPVTVSTIDECGTALLRMLERWNVEQSGLMHLDLIMDLKDQVPYSSAQIQAIVYNLAIALEPMFAQIQCLPLHQAANAAWADMVRAEESGMIDCSPGEFHKIKVYQPSAFERELLALLAEARGQYVAQLEDFRMAA